MSVWATAGLLGVLVGVAALIGPALGEAQAKKKMPTGTLTVQVKGLPSGSSADVNIQGKGYRKKVTKSGRTLLKKLPLTRYSIKVKEVSIEGGRAVPTRPSQSVALSRRKPKGAVTVTYQAQKTDPLIASTISAGRDHNCAIRESGQAVCWGLNSSGQLGNGTEADSNVPVNVQGLDDVVEISAGSQQSCAILQFGQAVCWGGNTYGQLGNGTNTDSNVPVNVAGLADGVEISAGDEHTCAIRQSGQAVCWGSNEFGQLGNGTDGNESDVPVDVEGLDDAVKISGGFLFTCATSESGQAVCWGNNDFGQLGNGIEGYISSNVPVNVAGLNDAKEISNGGFHACAIRQSGQAVCWGYNFYGQLGNGTSGNNSSNVPVNVQGLGDAIVISAGRGDHTCAIRESGPAVCWGYNLRGQLGNGTDRNESDVPGDVVGLDDTLEISAGGQQSCAIRQSGQAVCWGDNDYGQLGHGMYTDSNVPVNVRSS